MKRAAIITASDSGYRGEREDLSGPADPGRFWKEKDMK